MMMFCQLRWCGRAIAGFILLGVAAPVGAQTPPADSLWAAGSTDAAAVLYEARLAADSTDATALHRVAILRAWSGNYRESLALFDRLQRVAPGNSAAALDRARVLAWSDDHAAAVGAVNAVLAREPDNWAALEARAQFTSWAGLYDLSLATYGALLERAPGNTSLRQARARVLGWAGRYDAAVEAWQGLLEVEPGDTAALLGLGQVLGWSGQYDSAAVVLARILERDPGNMAALRSSAQVASWRGDLATGERLWRKALAIDSTDIASMVGLGATLRWLGRDAEALAVLRRAQAIAPQNADLREQLRYARAAIAPRFSPAVVYESDSDGNWIATTTLAGSWRMRPGLDVYGDVFLREIEQRRGLLLDGQTRGGSVSLAGRWPGGWRILIGAGVHHANQTDEAHATYRAALATPTRYPLSGRMDYSRSPLDATALAVERGVVLEQWVLSALLQPSPAWGVSGRMLMGEFQGTEDNRRWWGQLQAERRLGRNWAIGAAAHRISFEKDLAEGYFDPEYYALAEASAQWSRERGSWRLSTEFAPGVQQVGAEGPWTGTARASGRIAFLLAPGREVGLAAGFASNGLREVSTGTADYRYRSFTLSGAWAF